MSRNIIEKSKILIEKIFRNVQQGTDIKGYCSHRESRNAFNSVTNAMKV